MGMGIIQDTYDPHLPWYGDRFPGWNRSAVPPGECHEGFKPKKTGDAGLCAMTIEGSSMFDA